MTAATMSTSTPSAAALSDLPVTEQDELLEDVATSLDESGESELEAIERLGSPKSASRRSCAPRPASPVRRLPRVHGDTAPVVRRGALCGGSPALPHVRALAPAWWLARGYVARRGRRAGGRREPSRSSTRRSPRAR